MLLSYEDFPWFKDDSVRQFLNVQGPALGHFYWPDLDVDLGVETIRRPDRFCFEVGMMHGPALQTTATPLRGLPAAELGRYRFRNRNLG